MGPAADFDAMADACIENHKAILDHGSSGMQELSRLLLYALAEEIRRRHGIATWPPFTEADLLAPEE